MCLCWLIPTELVRWVGVFRSYAYPVLISNKHGSFDQIRDTFPEANTEVWNLDTFLVPSILGTTFMPSYPIPHIFHCLSSGLWSSWTHTNPFLLDGAKNHQPFAEMIEASIHDENLGTSSWYFMMPMPIWLKPCPPSNCTQTIGPPNGIQASAPKSL